MSGRDLQIGSSITVSDGRTATVRFLGLTDFSEGQWVGIELKGPTGKNDGEVKGVRYFTCKPAHGMFVRPSAVATVLPPAPTEEDKQGPRTSSNTSARQSGPSASLKRPRGIAATAMRRQTTNASTPTPAPKVGPRSSLRVCPLSLSSATPCS